MKQMVPLYTWSRDDATWQARLALLNRGDCVVVTGSASRPDTTEDPWLARRLATLKDMGVTRLGYVALGYGDRDIGDIIDDIVCWRVVHGVRRVFFDEWPADWGYGHLGTLWGAVRGYAGRGTAEEPIMCVNPGVRVGALVAQPPPDGTLVVTHEAPYAPFPAAGHEPRPWEVALVHTRPDVADVTRHLEASGWQWGHVTSDGADGNPFDGVAS